MMSPMALRATIIFFTVSLAAAPAQLRSPNPNIAAKAIPGTPRRRFGPTYSRHLAKLPSPEAQAENASVGGKPAKNPASRGQKVKRK